MLGKKQYADYDCVYAVALPPLNFIQMNIVLRNFAFFAVFFIASVAHSQRVTLQEQLSWFDLDSDDQTTGLGFTGAVFERSDVDFPIFAKRVMLNQFLSPTGYRITAEEVTILPEFLFEKGELAKLPQDWEVRTRLSTGGNVPYLVVEVLPLRNYRGQIQRLKSFTLEVDCQPSPSAQLGQRLSFASESKLKEGSWFKLAIGRDGIYKIDRNTLQSLGVDVAEIDPRNINLYGNGGELLPMSNADVRYDDLQKNAIFIQGEADGSFDNSDFILFYGKGTDSWNSSNALQSRPTWSHHKHFYSDSSYYFLRIDDTEPMRMASGTPISDASTVTVTTFEDYQYLENETYNLGESGREYFGDKFDITTSASYNFSFPNITSDSAAVEARVAVRSLGAPSSFKFTCFGQNATTTPSATSDFATARVANLGSVRLLAQPTSATVRVDVLFTKANADAQGYIDFIRVNAKRNLLLNGSQMHFRNADYTGQSQIALYQLGSANSATQLWDISDFLHPVPVTASLAGNVLEWKESTMNTHEYIAFNAGGYLAPTAVGPVTNQNLHALSDIDLVVVSAPGHIESARALGQIHADRGAQVLVTTPDEIFNEFSSGVPDVTAIRMLMKMLYDRAGNDVTLQPQNLLLFGDGDYSANRGLAAQRSYNVMVFESDESLLPVGSYVSDDYYVLLSDDDQGTSFELLDCGVGRIPAMTFDEGSAYVDKVRAYLANNASMNGAAWFLGDAEDSPYGSWRNILTFISDDQDGSGGAEPWHQKDSEKVTARLSSEHPVYDIQKIYMDSFTQESTPGGERYPEGSEAIRRSVQDGSLLVCYIGHGGERGFAHERILTIPTINSFTNINTLPLFLTATCELARYDNPKFHSAGEQLIMNPNGGAIGMLTTTRIVYSGSNFELDTAFFQVALDNATIADLTFGKINMLTKNGVPIGNSSKANFSLLADPMLQLSYPKYDVYTTSINDIADENFVDTLKALQRVKFKGFVGDNQGNKLTDFNGFIYPTVFDKKSHVFNQNNDDAEALDFYTFNKVIYKGTATVTGGDFQFEFVVPYDINYAVDYARVSYYAVNGNRDGHGYNMDFKVGSVLASAQLNNVGPEVELFMNDTTFVSGGVTNKAPLFLAKLRDENGINTAGTGIGHDLVAYLDGNTQDPIVLNQYYRSDLDTYQSGQVRYKLSDLNVGQHTIRMRAWDVHNNSSERSLDFLVSEDATLALQHVLNYPNPFTTHTEFFFEHNQANEVLDIRIQIFTVGGKLVKTLTQESQQSGFRSQPIPWDGTDDFGDRLGKGVYVYKVEVRGSEGKKAEKYEKLVILK
jgi:hypothetical protein